MAFRRFNRFRSKGRFGGRRSFRRGLKRAHDGARWERCYFHHSVEVDAGDIGTTGSVNYLIELASLRNMFDLTVAPSRALGSAMRSMEVGGIVIAANVDLTSDVHDVEGPSESQFSVMHFICTDRMQHSSSSDAGFPVSTTADWNSVGTPMANASGVEQSAVDSHFPTQIHWRDVDIINKGLDQYVDSDPLVLHVPSQNTVRSIRRVRNLRLRRRLGDEEGLFYAFAIVPNAGWTGDESVLLRATLTGTIYYRVRF